MARARFQWLTKWFMVVVLVTSQWGALLPAPVQAADGLSAPLPQGPSLQANINKSFSPISISAGGLSTLTVTIFNPNAFPLTLSSVPAAWTDTLPAGMTFANPSNAANTCGGTVTTVGTTLSLVGGTVPAQVNTTPGSCQVTVSVTSKTTGNLINTIPVGNLQSTNPTGDPITNPSAASATLQVNSVQPPSLSKAFAKNTIWVGETTRLTLTIRNNDTNTMLQQLALTDALPANVRIATPANAATTCAGGTVSTTPTSLTLNNGTVAISATCTVSVDVISNTAGVYTNLVPANAISTQQGATNATAASAPLNVQDIGMTKAFNPGNFQAGGSSLLTITLQNPSSVDYTNAAFTDTLPAGLTVATPANLATTCPGGTPATSVNSVSLSGATVPHGTIITPGSCTVSVRVTSSVPATYTNRIPAGALTTTEGASNVAAAVANVTVYAPGAGLTASKRFNNATTFTIPVNGVSTLSINFQAPADTALSGVAITDALPAGVRVAAVPNASTTNCGAPVYAPASGDTLLTLSGGTIAAGVTCTLRVDVTSSVPGVYVNTVSAANITNAQNRNLSGPISATLTVSGIGVSKSFSPSTVNPGGISTLTIVLTNDNVSQLDAVSLTDTLPGTATRGLWLAPNPRAITNCTDGSAVLTAAAGTQTITLANGTVPAKVGNVAGICTILVDVVGRDDRGTQQNYSNTIPANSVSGTIHGTPTVITNPSAASATLSILPISIGIVKGFNPVSVTGGAASILTVTLTNPNNIPLTGIAFTDTLPQRPPDGGMTIASPANLSVGTCGGVLTAAPGATTFSFANGSLLANSACSLILSVTMDVENNLTNTIGIGAVTTTNGASNTQAASASLTNLPGVSISKVFTTNPIFSGAGNQTTLSMTIRNVSNFPLSGLRYTDTFPVGVSVSAAPASAQCGGTVTSTLNSVSLTSGTLAAYANCTIVVDVTAPAAGSYLNCIPVGGLSSTQGASNATAACDTLRVVNTPAAPVISKAFAPLSIPAGTTAGLTFTLRNPVANTVPLTGVSFTDVLPVGMDLASIPNPTQCGGTVSTTGMNTITLTGGVLAVNSTCAVTVSVTTTGSGIYNNTSGAVSSTNGGTGNTASATLTVVSPPSILKSFTPATIPSGGSATVQFTITNPNPATALTGVSFTDAMPAGLIVAAPANASTTGCGAATFVPAPGAASLTLSGATIAAGGTCTVAVSVTANGGTYANSVTVISTNGGTGNTSTSTLTVTGSGLSLTKTSPTNSYHQAGDSLTYQYLLRNTGSGTLYAPFSITDDRVTSPTPDCAGIVSLAPNATGTCTATYTVTAADVTARSVTNLATASAHDSAGGGGNIVNSNQSSATVRVAVLTLRKQTITAGYRSAAQTITYTYTLTNTGDVPLYGTGTGGVFRMTDDHIGVFDCIAGVPSLAPGANVVCTNRNYTVIAADVANGSVTNLASATSTDQAGGGLTVPSNTDTVTVYRVNPPSIAKAFAPVQIAVGGSSILTITITNPASNVVPLSGVGFIDNLPAGVTVANPPDAAQCGGTVTSTATSITLAGGTVLPNSTCDVTVRVTASGRGVYNNTIASVSSTNGGAGGASNTATLTVIAPPVISKAFSPATVLVGGTSTLTLTITNPNPAAVLTGVAVNDAFPAGLQVAAAPNAQAINCGTPTFAPLGGDTTLAINNVTLAAGGTCTLSVDVTATTLGMKNNITSPVTSTEGGTGATSNTATLTVDSPSLGLVKSITAGSPYTALNGAITYSYLLTNTGNVTLIGDGVGGRFTITDDQIGTPPGTAFNCPLTPTGLSPSATLTCTAAATVTQLDLDNGSVTNIATGHGLYGTTPVTTNPSTQTAIATQTPGVSLTKTITAGNPYTAAGAQVQYSYLIRNTGNVTITGTGPGGAFIVTDDHIAVVTCPAAPTSLGSGATLTCTASYTLTQADVNAGSVVNHASVDVLWGSTPLNATSTQTATATQTPALTLAKTIASGNGYRLPGDGITYQYQLTNTGNGTLTGNGAGGLFTITDDHIGVPAGTAFDCGTLTSLDPTQSVTCTATYTVIQADVDGGSVTNLANGHGLWGTAAVTSNPDSVTATANQTPDLVLAKVIQSGSPYAAVGDLVTYQYTITNNGNVTLTGASLGNPFTLTDDHIGTPPGTAFDCTAVTSLAPTASVTCTAVYTITQADLDRGSLTNLANAHGTFGNANVTSNQATATASATQNPALTLAKTVTAGAVYQNVGDLVQYSYLLTNTGNVTLDGGGPAGEFTVTDDRVSVTCPIAPTSLVPLASVTCTATYTITQDDLNAGSVTNQAVGNSLFGNTPIHSNTDQQTVAGTQLPRLEIIKSITSGSPYQHVGDTVTYQYELHNTGNVTLTGADPSGAFLVTDDRVGTPKGTPFPCQATQTSLLPGNRLTCSATYTITQADLDHGSLVNQASGHALFGTTAVDSNVATQTATATTGPALRLEKSITAGSPYTTVNGQITYTYILTNTGNVTLTGDSAGGLFTITDDQIGAPTGTPFACGTVTTLAPGDTITCTALFTVSQVDIDRGSVVNHANGHARYNTDPITSNPASATANVALARITGIVFVDADLSQVQNGGEVGLGGVTVWLYDSTGTILIATATTAADGSYSFNDLPPGSYQVIEQDPLHYTSTTPNVIAVDVPPATTGHANFGDNLVQGTDANQISGIAYNDANNNGVYDAGEELFANVTIRLYDQNGTLVGTQQTGPDGSYLFDNLPAGVYTVVETNPSGYVSTTLDHVSVVLQSGTHAVVNFGDRANPGSATVIDPAVTKYGSPSAAKVGDTVIYTITVGNNGNADAPDVVFRDTLPAFLDVVSVSVSPQKQHSIQVSGITISITFGTLTPADFYTITVVTRVNNQGTPPGGDNQAMVQTSAQQDPTWNNRALSHLTIFVVPTGKELPRTGFAPGVVTDLPQQPDSLRYAAQDMTIEIPALNLKSTIVGVPVVGNTWDVTWLGRQIGYLDGTAFPTWAGNSVLTGHVYDADGLPGPFVNLGKLKWGDQIILHAFGQTVVYEVRSVGQTDSVDRSVFRHEDLPWVTLVTCKDYNEKTGTYAHRVVVKAVMVSTQTR